MLRPFSHAIDRPPVAGPAPLTGWVRWLPRWLIDSCTAQARIERDDAQRALQVINGQLRTVFEQASDGLLICGADGKVLACNPHAAMLLDARRSEIVGKPLASWLQQAASDPSAPLRNGEAAALRPVGDPLPVEVTLRELPGPEGVQWLIQLRDLSDRRQVQERLEKLANYDSLTGLPNRSLFRDRLQQAMSRAQRSGEPMALMFLDLDRFKVVNDSLGHEVGDRLLLHVTHTIGQCLRGTDTLGRADDGAGYLLSRLGGDEFTVIAEGIGGAEDAAMVAKRLLEALHAPFIVGDEEIVVSASIGITTYPTDDVDLDTLLRHTDMAMYRAKSTGRDTYCFFSDDLNASVSARLSLEGSLRRAIEREEFTLHYQPKADIATGTVTCVETLIRWHCPGRGLVPPDRFISVLEDTGLILPVGAWVIRSACAQLAAWDREGLPPLRLAINVSARQFRHPYLVALVEDTLRENAIDPARIEIELTESLLMEDTEATRGMLANFARIGLRLALDDFGTGHSSLAYLKRFAIDTLKIDRSFVTALSDDEEDRAIAGAVVALGHSMGMTVVAEGVETEAQRDILRGLGCDEIQGYLLSRPLPPAEFHDWLRARLDHTPRVGPEATRTVESVSPIRLAVDRSPDIESVHTGPIDVLTPSWTSTAALPVPRPVKASVGEPQAGITVWALGQSLAPEPSVPSPVRPVETAHKDDDAPTALDKRRLTAGQRAARTGATLPARRRWLR